MLFSGILVGKIIFALCIAKFFIVFAFDGFYVYSAELFPTVIRYSMTRLHFSKSRSEPLCLSDRYGEWYNEFQSNSELRLFLCFGIVTSKFLRFIVTLLSGVRQ